MIIAWLNKLKIGNKLILLLVIPISAVLLFSTVGVLEKWHRFKDVRSTRDLIHISQSLSAVVYEFQKERGLSTDYFRNQNQETRQQLEVQWEASDTQLTLLALNFQKIAENPRTPELLQDLSNLLLDFNKRIALRENIDIQENRQRLFKYYASSNAEALYLVERMGMAMEDAALVKKGRAYSKLLWLQEYAELEREIFNEVLAAGVINREELEKIQKLISEQQALLTDLRQVTFSEVDHEQLSILLSGPGERRIEEVRQLVHIKLEKLDRLNALQSLIGYGGMIQHFKDYVLRGDEKYLDQFHVTLFEAGKLIHWYQSSPGLSMEERLALAVVTATFEEYRGAIITVEELYRRGLPVTLIDRSVKVNDGPALAAFDYLRRSFGEIGVKTWFESASERIRHFKVISEQIGQELNHLAEKETQASLTALIGYITVTIMALIISLILWVRMSTHLVSGIALIIKTLGHVEETGDYSGHVEVRGSDEVAKMAESVNSLIRGRRAIENKLQLASRVFDNTIDGVIITDANEKIISINPSVTRITGYTQEELLGKTPRMLSSDRQDKIFFKEMWRSIHTTGHWQGEIWNRRKNGETYPEWQNINEVKDTNGMLTNYISVFSDISAIKRSQEQMEHLAHHDPLTNLPNRLLFEKRLTRAMTEDRRKKQSLALFFLDLDHFKNINDSLGHAAGDALLCEVSQRMIGVIRKQDTIARLGGDEFAIILERFEGVRSVVQVAKKIIHSLKQPFILSDQEVFTSTSIGISIYPIDGETPDRLIKNADAAMYHAKNEGRNNYQFYDKTMTEAAFERLEIENRLRQAMRQEEFVLYYQPQLSFKTGEIIGVEALIRWQDPEHGLVLPGKFLPVAEEMGLIQEIDSWVIHEACREAQQWREEGLRPMTMSVNLSKFNLEHGGFMETVQSALKESQLPAQWLELEITEGNLIQHQDRVSEALSQLREEGVGLAIDDFGTGYSSLSYLRHLPFDKLKIDRSFVHDITNDQNAADIIIAVIALGHALHLKVLAEGVETEAQAKMLFDLQCDMVQGNLYYKPLLADDFKKMIKKTSAG